MRLKHIDGLKLIFCFAVVLYHYYIVLCQCDINQCFRLIPDKVYSYGYLGVEFFFVVSGLLISYTYKEKLVNGEISVGHFCKRRFISLYPMFAISNLLCMAITIMDSGYQKSELTKSTASVYNAICVFSMNGMGTFHDHNFNFNSSLWFVNVLLICYVIYSFLSSRAKNKGQYVICMGIMVLVGWFCIVDSPGLPFLYYENGRAYVGFFVGCLLYELQLNLSEKALKIMSYIGMTIMVAIGIVCMSTKSSAIWGNVDISLEILGFPLLILIVDNIKPIRRLLDNRFVNRISVLSTSVYFSHYIVFLTTRLIDTKLGLGLCYSSAKVFLVEMLFIVVCSIIFKVLVEDRATRYIKSKIKFSE